MTAKLAALTIVIALAMITPAAAFGDHMSWDCGNGTEVTLWKNQLHLSIDRHLPQKIAKSLKLKWDFSGGIYIWMTEPNVWLNGKECMIVQDRTVWQESCAKGEKEACETMKENWPDNPKQPPLLWSFETLRKICLDVKDRPEEETKQTCSDSDKLKKRVEARGYCIYDHRFAGRPSKNRKHCYAIKY